MLSRSEIIEGLKGFKDFDTYRDVFFNPNSFFFRKCKDNFISQGELSLLNRLR